MTSSAAEAPKPLLCQLKRDDAEEEYGFNLHAERGRLQFIGAVDAGTIAEAAGLRAGHRILAVNRKPVQGLTHKEVVARIKENPLGCSLLVMDAEGEAWHRDNNVPFSIHHANTTTMQTPPSPPTSHSSQSSASMEEAECDYDSVPPLPTSQPPPIQPLPRLCTLQRSSPDEEYGFSLHFEESHGHFIGAIDEDSLAEAAGLEKGQRIVGVNDVLVYPTSPHSKVVALIKKEALRAKILVASPHVDAFYVRNGLQYHFQQAEIARRDGEMNSRQKRTGQPHAKQMEYVEEARNGESRRAVHGDSSDTSSESRHWTGRGSESESERNTSPGSSSTRSAFSSALPSPLAAAAASPPQILPSTLPSTARPAPLSEPTLEAMFTMSAKEMRLQLEKQKRVSGEAIKASGLSMQQKHDILRKM